MFVGVCVQESTEVKRRIKSPGTGVTGDRRLSATLGILGLELRASTKAVSKGWGDGSAIKG